MIIIPILFAFGILSGIPSVFAEEPSVDVDSLLNEADNFFKLEKYEDAISIYDRILSVEPGNLEALGKKGDAMASLGKLEQARCFLISSFNHIRLCNHLGITSKKLPKPFGAIAI